ncbi:hypothetical protein M0R45_004198 [Rubus argutus]|uniref:Uncharacterized protein n=1 Tax=Rubus argutus TaxID=59490 RepID=A0AAW1YJ52_RUBAR
MKLHREVHYSSQLCIEIEPVDYTYTFNFKNVDTKCLYCICFEDFKLLLLLLGNFQESQGLVLWLEASNNDNRHRITLPCAWKDTWVSKSWTTVMKWKCW